MSILYWSLLLSSGFSPNFDAPCSSAYDLHISVDYKIEEENGEIFAIERTVVFNESDSIYTVDWEFFPFANFGNTGMLVKADGFFHFLVPYISGISGVNGVRDARRGRKVRRYRDEKHVAAHMPARLFPGKTIVYGHKLYMKGVGKDQLGYFFSLWMARIDLGGATCATYGYYFSTGKNGDLPSSPPERWHTHWPPPGWPPPETELFQVE